MSAVRQSYQRSVVKVMSKNDKKEQLDNPFAGLAKMHFPSKEEKAAEKKAVQKAWETKKASLNSVSYDEDAHLFLSSIGDVNPMRANKKIHEDLGRESSERHSLAQNNHTMAELLARSEASKKTVLKKEKKQTAVPPKTAAAIKQDESEEDSTDFLKAMQDVKSLDGKGRAVVPCVKENTLTPPPISNPLQDFMDGKLEFALNATEDYVEGHILGIDLMTVGKLQSRQYSPEAHIDLHGLNAEQAYHNLVAFFRNSYQRGLRTVLVVTGKGKNSVNGMPVLRNKVQEWFTKDPFRRVVIAFCTAKQEDGGTGALYVLIRKQKKNYGKVYWDLTPTDSDFFL